MPTTLRDIREATEAKGALPLSSQSAVLQRGESRKLLFKICGMFTVPSPHANAGVVIPRNITQLVKIFDYQCGLFGNTPLNRVQLVSLADGIAAGCGRGRQSSVSELGAIELIRRRLAKKRVFSGQLLYGRTCLIRIPIIVVRRFRLIGIGVIFVLTYPSQ
jgi:hypothetical protein